MDLERLTPKQFALFQEFIYRRSGIKVDFSKVTLVSNRIRRRVKANQLPDFEAYFQFLTSTAGKEELNAFLDAITTNETYFFRTPAHFDWFQNQFLAQLCQSKVDNKRSNNLRIWSAACSTGEEPYSLAICLHEHAARLRGWEITILGTDISVSALQKAREAVYGRRSLHAMDEGRIHRNFEQLSPDAWKLKPRIAEMVQYKHHNLMKPLGGALFDCIWIRNVLIYFDRESKTTVLRNLVHAMTPGGYLVVGPSEGVYDMLGMLQRRSTFLYQKPLDKEAA